MIDVSLLATTVVSNFLLPYVKLGAEKIADRIAGKVGDAAAEHGADVAERVWDAVTNAFTSDEEKATTLEQFKKRPDASKPLLEELLKETLEQDPTLRSQLSTLIESPSPAGGTTVQLMGETVGYVDARGAQISGTVSGVYVGTPQPKTPPQEGQQTGDQGS